MKTKLKILAGFGAALIGLAAPAHAEWQVATTKHFMLYSNDSPAAVEAYASKLERFDKAVRTLRNMPDLIQPWMRVRIFVVKDADELHRLMGEGSENIGGFYRPQARGPVAFMFRQGADSAFLRGVLFHEYTHHIMLTSWAGAVFPGWFTEGFAEFHATPIIQSDGSFVFGAPPQYRRYGVGELNLMPLERVMSPNPKLDDARTGDAFYARAWLLMDYLTFDQERRNDLAAYIGAINSGKSFTEAAKLLQPGSLTDLKLNSWGKRPRLPSAVVSGDKITGGEVKLRAATPGEAAILPMLIHSTVGVNKKTAPNVAAQARAAADAFPSDAFVQNELAEAEFDAERYDAAGAAAERAFAADPSSVHALVYKGLAEAATLKKAKVSDPARWQAARRSFLAANKLDPENPWPLQAFYESFVDADQVPTKNAEAALLYAQALAPFDDDLRVPATKILLRQGKVPEAKAMLQPVAYGIDQDNPKDRTYLVKALATIEAGDPAGALKMIEDGEAAAKKKAEAEKAKKGGAAS